VIIAELLFTAPHSSASSESLIYIIMNNAFPITIESAILIPQSPWFIIERIYSKITWK
jgi:hypothetical protein